MGGLIRAFLHGRFYRYSFNLPKFSCEQTFLQNVPKFFLCWDNFAKRLISEKREKSFPHERKHALGAFMFISHFKTRGKIFIDFLE